jgi:hypothetical protein
MDEKRLEDLAAYYDGHDIDEDIDRARLQQQKPVSRDEVMIVSSIRLPKTTMDRVREAATEDGTTPTALIRRWIREQLELRERAAASAPSQLDLLSQLMHRVVREELEEAGLRRT